MLRSFQTWMKSQVQRIAPHTFALSVVTLACVVGQVATLSQHPFYHLTADSPGYVGSALHILHHGQFFSPAETPGYPTLLAVIFLVRGEGHYNAVVLVQTLLMVMAVYGVYLLAFRLIGRQWAAMLTAGAVALDVPLLNWEREIMTETLALWFILATFLAFERAIRTNHPRWLIGSLALAGMAVVVRPFNFYLPALLVLLYACQVVRLRAFRVAWRPLLAALAVSYALVGGVILGNSISYGYTGLSYIGTINLLGKIMEYRLQSLPVDPQNAALSADLNTYIHSGKEIEPWHFTLAYPQYAVDYYAPVARFDDDIIFHHPLDFVAPAGSDILLALGAPSFDYARTAQRPFLAALLTTFGNWELLGYWLLPALALLALAWFLAHPRNGRMLALATLALAAALDVLITGAITYRTVLSNGSTYDEFYRMRVPFDWAMILVLVALPVLVGDTLPARRARKPTSAPASAPDAVEVPVPITVAPAPPATDAIADSASLPTDDAPSGTQP